MNRRPDLVELAAWAGVLLTGIIVALVAGGMA
jgi:hypothetical protein